MPSVSKKQFRFMQAVKKAKEDPSYGSGKVKKAAKSMSKQDVEDFTGHSPKGLPEKKEEDIFKSPVVQEAVREKPPTPFEESLNELLDQI
jgi:hypothetical protein